MRIVVYTTSLTPDSLWRMGRYVLIENEVPIRTESIKVDYDRDFPNDVTALETLIRKHANPDKIIRL